MATPAELREQSRLFREMAKTETEPQLRRHLAANAMALAQLAEKIERDKAITGGDTVMRDRLK